MSAAADESDASHVLKHTASITPTETWTYDDMVAFVLSRSESVGRDSLMRSPDEQTFGREALFADEDATECISPNSSFQRRLSAPGFLRLTDSGRAERENTPDANDLGTPFERTLSNLVLSRSESVTRDDLGRSSDLAPHLTLSSEFRLVLGSETSPIRPLSFPGQLSVQPIVEPAAAFNMFARGSWSPGVKDQQDTQRRPRAEAGKPSHRLSLAQRRGLSVRRLSLVDAERARQIAGRLSPRESQKCAPRQRFSRPHQKAEPTEVSRPRHNFGVEPGENPAFQRQNRTMGEYHHAMVQLRRKRKNGNGSEAQEGAGTLERRPQCRPRTKQEAEDVGCDAVTGPPARPALVIRILMASFLLCRMLLLLPFRVVTALFSSKPPWLPDTPSSEPRHPSFSPFRHYSPFRSNNPVWEALSEPCTP